MRNVIWILHLKDRPPKTPIEKSEVLVTAEMQMAKVLTQDANHVVQVHVKTGEQITNQIRQVDSVKL